MCAHYPKSLSRWNWVTWKYPHTDITILVINVTLEVWAFNKILDIASIASHDYV